MLAYMPKIIPAYSIGLVSLLVLVVWAAVALPREDREKGCRFSISTTFNLSDYSFYEVVNKTEIQKQLILDKNHLETR